MKHVLLVGQSVMVAANGKMASPWRARPPPITKLTLGVLIFVAFWILLAYNSPSYTLLDDDDNDALGAVGGQITANGDVRMTMENRWRGRDGPGTNCSKRLSPSPCEEIHVAIVCSGFEQSRDIVPLIKSSLFYTNNPVHFHFISDEDARLVLGTLFRTWQIPGVRVSYYPAEGLQRLVAWFPNRHEFKPSQVAKLLLASVLPQELEKVIALNIDLTFAADIAELWWLFEELAAQDRAIGLVESQSDLYAGRPWATLGGGYDTGVMLMRLNELRRLSWMQVWKTVVEKITDTSGAVLRALTDQDIINAVIKDYPYLHMTLPCTWNLQLSKQTISEVCFSKLSELKILHWTSPRKQNIQLNNINFFRSLHTTFLEYNGNLLRQRLPSTCSSSNSAGYPGPGLHRTGTLDQTANKGSCSKFREASSLTYRTHLFYMNYKWPEPKAFDVALVAQLSMDRLHVLEALCLRWKGPMSLALFVSDSELQQFLKFANESKVISDRTNIAIHVVYKADGFHPVNFLRNVALNEVRQPYVFLSDIDFLPRYGMYNDIRATLAEFEPENSRKALIVPAFEILNYRTRDFPKSKSALIRMMDQEQVFSFHYHVWPQGHAPTDFKRWRTSTAPYRVKWAASFEPYVVVPSNVTRYDMRFVGFGWNKVSHIMELNAQLYDFYVLPHTFIIHMPHAPSPDVAKYHLKWSYRKCMSTLKMEFLRDLMRKYGASAMRYKNLKLD
ncbi:xylosyl- and glucuronyltransferase LARGE2s-like [Sycon ciliatum]|uniref:xylosyl- and glucuronyltransferase LARGE2s-like n=1 Tax=Sycon ciliatum TaxID=27933 RepID=UPI0020ABA834|eukprot:scpid30197/ scgid30240/ Glycosyltransferase-like protein LARGE1; Acetylglucosaminyltransferase-like 1A